ncbi:OmpA family protein [Leptospira broomii serovar Hurstbridge str. 5399]|uniref:OmpA family protein n=1 Tax=Leptospira broomii serovar Hurstbridge str. 5399 TaxID=1049789 RepID=T0F558_9LEPT|nr:OmpA family protein [Leptospira broomii]EQA46250.1 OmpA family protein [Leptospira broomii serovar Hurstbridge str. 5399]
MAKKQNYYVTINGKKYDRGLIEIADASVSGKRDGRISVNDAKKLLNAVKDNNTYTDIEKKTIEHIRENYKFTDKADEWFRSEIRKWAAEKSAKTKSAEPEELPPAAEEISDLSIAPSEEDDSYLGYTNYIPTPSAGKPRTRSGIPILLLSILILSGIGIGIYYAFGSSKEVSKSSAYKHSAAKKKEENIVEKREPKKDSTPDKAEKGVFSLFSGSGAKSAKLEGTNAELAKQIESSAIHFDKNSISVLPSSRKTLDHLSKLLKRKPELKASLTGHTSNEGKEEANLKVSKLRAEMVRDYLIGNGIANERVLIQAKGATEPIAENSSEAGKEKNRRVEIRIVE